MNWQAECDRVISEHEGKKLLLHACCAPCASASLEYLTQHFDTDLFFYNPNIYPENEFEARLSELKRFAAEYPFSRAPEVFSAQFVPEEFYSAVKGFEKEPERGERCRLCFALRLDAAAAFASAQGYDLFATTLTISPLKSPDDINLAGLEAGKRRGIAYLPTDLKKKGRFLRSTELSEEYHLYRQNYCGCVFSANGRK